MDLSDVQRCADFYQLNYLETFYLVNTYYGRSFVLIGERENFPHLMGIANKTYKSNGYRTPKALYRDIISRVPIPYTIIPRSISLTSKMYKKVLNFQRSTEVFWNNKAPLSINYNPSLSSYKLDVDVLVSDIKSGYMLGWTVNKSIPVNAEINLIKYCISSWIDESGGSTTGKEKYLLSQDVELIRYVFAFNKNSELIRQKEYRYSADEKKDMLRVFERNNGNLLVDANNLRFYVDIAKKEGIHCRINGVIY